MRVMALTRATTTGSVGALAQRSFVARLRSAGGPSHDLLVLLDAHRVMTTGQLARASGAPERTVTYRLNQLREAGLIDCVRPGRETGSEPQHWWLKPAGARIVTGTAAAEGSPSGMFVKHAATITEVWLALAERGAGAGVALTGWQADRAGWQEWPPPSGFGIPRRLTPDAVAQADLASGQAAFFVEVDLATMTQTQLKAKLANYLAYAEDRAWRPGGHPHCPPLLFLTTTAARATTFMRAAERALAAHERAVGRRWGEDAAVVHAEKLMVAACGLVRDPARAVVEHCWLLPDQTLGEVSLAEILAERVAAQATADVILAAQEADRNRRDDAALLHDLIYRQKDSLRAELGEHAIEVLDHLDRVDARIADAQPDLAQALLSWSQGDTPPVTTTEVRELLAALHRKIWTGQARAVLGAQQLIAADDPKLHGYARVLLDGHLLTRWHITDLTRPPISREQREQDALHDYLTERDTETRRQHDQLPWLTRRRTSPADLAAVYDEQHLLVCGTCAMPVRDPDPNGEHWRDAEECKHCRAGRPIPYTRRHEVPTLAVLCDELRHHIESDKSPA
jgi:DNA-binding transcriptional ArsR family regulator